MARKRFVFLRKLQSILSGRSPLAPLGDPPPAPLKKGGASGGGRSPLAPLKKGGASGGGRSPLAPLKKGGRAYCVVAVSLTLVIVLGHTVGWAYPKPTTAPQLVQQGRTYYEAGQFENALVTWQKAADAYAQMSDERGIIGSQINQAQALSAMGFSRRACKTLVQALKVDNEFCETSNQKKTLTLPKQKPSFLINIGLRSLGDVLRVIGNLEKSQDVLQQSWEIAQQLSSPEAKGDTMLSLGNTERALGDRERERQDTIDLATYYQPAIEFYQKATAYYQQSAGESSLSNAPIQAKLNRLSLLIEIEQWLLKRDRELEADSERSPLASLRSQAGAWEREGGMADNWASQVQPQITELLKIQPAVAALPSSHDAVYAKINFARSLTLFSLKQGFDRNNSSWKDVNQLLNDAIQQAKDLGDKQAEAYAVGNLGWMYEQTGQLPEALESTQQALKRAKEIKAQEIVYQWEWQLGRILTNQKQPDIKEARAAYERAIDALETIRQDLTAVNKDAQFSFRDDVEPLYRQLVNLVLRTEEDSEPGRSPLAPLGDPPPAPLKKGGASGTELSADNLKQAIKRIDDLQLAELENFLGCRVPKLVQSDQISPISQVTNQIDRITKNKAALIYPIVLENRVALLFKLPNQPLKYHETIVSRKEVKKKLRQLRDYLVVPSADVAKIEELSKEVYEWIFRPIEESLKKSHDVETLVFVLDGELRNIPMAALYDGDEYLVEKDYSIAIAPSLQLVDSRYRVGKLKVLIGGIEKYPKSGITAFPDLTLIKEQLQQIKKEVDASEILFNEQFNKENLQRQLQANRFSAVHMATHGKFSSNPEETFIVGYKELIKPNDLSDLIQSSNKGKVSSIELLVLSVCETAQGDNRAILGLAGLAVQSGVGSTLSTLWSAPEQPTTELVVEFYKELSKPNITTAKALHLAQKALFDIYSGEPYSWAPYTLVGNWL